MSRHGATRNLTLTEELEKLEQSITLTLQEIDSNFSKAHRIVTSSILPIVEEYAKHSSEVWEGSKFWKQFFEASANVSLSGYEEAAADEDVTHDTTTTSTNLDTPIGHGDYLQSGDQQQQEDDDEEFSVDSPTQITGMQTTPKLGSARKTEGKATTTSFRSPSPRKYTGKNPLAIGVSSGNPSTPRARAAAVDEGSSPFEPNSALYQPSTQARINNDPLMHRILDKNYRVQATPHTQRRQPTAKPNPPTATKRVPWDDSPQSSPAAPAPQLRSELFSPAKTVALRAPRTPGVSVLTPARKTGQPAPTTSTGRQLFSPQDKAYATAKDRTSHTFDDSDDDDDLMSPPKTMAFNIPQSRLMQTPAREASKRIVEDLLLTAGAGDDTDDDLEGIGDQSQIEEPSPSVVRRVYEDDTF